MQEQSIFTRIINGEIPCHKIYEDERVIAILDAYPMFEGHTLVIPKVQIDHIWDLSDDDYDYLWKVSKKIGKHLHQVIGCPRIGVVVEGFGVPHAHIHLIPIYKRNDLQKPDKLKFTDEQLAIIANRLRM